MRVCSTSDNDVSLQTKQTTQGVVSYQNMLCAIRCVPMTKPGGGIRLIALGQVFYLFVAKTIFSVCRVDNDLMEKQYGSGIKRRVDPVVAAVERRILKCMDGIIMGLDTNNACDTIDQQHIWRPSSPGTTCSVSSACNGHVDSRSRIWYAPIRVSVWSRHHHRVLAKVILWGRMYSVWPPDRRRRH